MQASNTEAYKKSRYALRRTIKQAKHQCRAKTELYYTGSDARLMLERAYKLLQTTASAVPDDCVITLSVADLSKTFKQVNIYMAARQDRLPGRVLLACADQLASVFTGIFNMSLIESVIPTCFKADHHSPCAQEHEGNLPK